ncbi:hypothetical protein KTE19_02185 [Lentilactobacillus sp. IMAU92037]|uniref:hypothetical protein n=1 Tax=Lentilactobacillus dabitei TaxID=2831523 RepID=UPI001C264938|nr:hypothetical protein [Lentilactobacillus dabitei]MBU9788162.1 hypothetical protein [Lentilactobacillus dabitei]MBV0929534.1 hypothetical protein [Lentilactobacillus dabitei]
MNLKRIFFSIIFGILNITALLLLMSPIMAIFNRQFQESDLYQIILVVTITLVLDVGTFQQIQN